MAQGRNEFAFFLSSRLGETERAIELLHDAQEQGLIHPGWKHFCRNFSNSTRRTSGGLREMY